MGLESIDSGDPLYGFEGMLNDGVFQKMNLAQGEMGQKNIKGYVWE